MKVVVKDLDGANTAKEMEVVVPKEDVNKMASEIYDDIIKTVTIKGFRKGKAPRNVIRMYYGDYVVSELSKRLVSEYFDKAIKEQGLLVVSAPEFTNDSPKEGKDFKFTAKFDVKPEVKLEKYTGLDLKKPSVYVSDNMVDDVIKRLRENLAEINDVEDREYMIKEGDFVAVDITCNDYPGLNRENVTVEAGSDKGFIPGLASAIVGLKLGEAKDIEVVFPDDHFMENMRGVETNIDVVIRSVRSRTLPELNDDFAKMARDGIESMEELKSTIRSELEERMENNARSALIKDAAEKLIEANPINIPESMVKVQAGLMIRGLSQRLMSQGIKLEDLYPDPEAFKEDTLKEAERIVRQSLIMEAIADEVGIEVEDDDLDKEISSMAQRYNVPPEEVRKTLEERGGIEDLKFSIIEKKVFDYIIDNSNVEEIDEGSESMEEGKDDPSTDSGRTDE